MNRSSTVLIAALLLGASACQDQSETADSKPADAKASNATKDTEPANAPAPANAPGEVAPAPAAPATPAAAATPEAASGLDLGMRFAAFDIINCDSGDTYCQVCKYGPNPKIMAVGTIDDEQFKADLKQLDALVQKHGEDRLKAFAVIAEPKDGALVTPLASRADLQAKAKALRDELGISIPVVIPAPKGDAPNGTFETHYNITASRTIMFADGRNQVKYSQVAPSDYSELEGVIAQILG